MIKLKWFCFWVFITCLSSCFDDQTEPLHFPPSFMEIPKGFEAFEVPPDNVYSSARWELGKKLFYDPIMSIDNTISCATCHKSELAFSDDIDFSPGIEERMGTRNAPTLANLAYHPYFTREGGVPTLEMQILVPIQEHNEFDFNIVLLAERLSLDSSYVKMSLDAYARSPDAFTITRALACFERSLISGYSPYDHFISYNDQQALGKEALRGMDLFFSEKTKCSSCHGGFNFTSYEIDNNGLYLEYSDVGRFRLTGEEEDLAKFKIPSLRNIELTSPYMHDGSIQTLEQVVDHYNNGGKNHPNKNEIIKPLNLSETEKSDLVRFLKSLTDDHFVNNPIFKE